VWHRMLLYSCTHMATVDVKGLKVFKFSQTGKCWSSVELSRPKTSLSLVTLQVMEFVLTVCGCFFSFFFYILIFVVTRASCSPRYIPSITGHGC